MDRDRADHRDVQWAVPVRVRLSRWLDVAQRDCVSRRHIRGCRIAVVLAVPCRTLRCRGAAGQRQLQRRVRRWSLRRRARSGAVQLCGILPRGLRVSRGNDQRDGAAVRTGAVCIGRSGCLQSVHGGLLLPRRCDVGDGASVSRGAVQHRRQWQLQPVCGWVLLPHRGQHNGNSECL